MKKNVRRSYILIGLKNVLPLPIDMANLRNKEHR